VDNNSFAHGFVNHRLTTDQQYVLALRRTWKTMQPAQFRLCCHLYPNVLRLTHPMIFTLFLATQISGSWFTQEILQAWATCRWTWIEHTWRFRKSWGYPQFSSISIGFSSINLEKTIQPLGYPRDLGWFQGPPVSVRNALLQAQPVIGGNYGTLSTLNNHSIGDAIGYIL